MPNGMVNPLAAPLTMLKQVGEQTHQAIQTLGTTVTRTASQGLDTLISGVPGVPGVPGAPNGITPAALMPANLQQVLGQVENLLIPPGLPRPSQAMRPTAPPAPPAAPKEIKNAKAEPSAATARRNIVVERRGL